MATINATLCWGEQALAEQGSPALEASILLAHILAVTPTYLRTWPERVITSAQLTLYQHYCQRRQRGEPIAYILGEWDFWSLRLQITPAVLIPRPETEHLIEWILQQPLPATPIHLLDMGTGSGAIALALAKERPLWHIVATDASVEALMVARKNGEQLGISSVTWHLGSWFTPLEAKPTFQFIVSNPPYIAPNDPHLTQGDVQFEPQTALIAEDNGMADLVYLISHAQAFLQEGGWLVLEHGYDQGELVAKVMQQYDYKQIKTHTDLAGHGRYTVGRHYLRNNLDPYRGMPV